MECEEYIYDESVVRRANAAVKIELEKKGCEAVKVEREIPLSYLEKRCFQVMAEENRARGVALANDICRKNRRTGKYFDELLDEVWKG